MSEEYELVPYHLGYDNLDEWLRNRSARRNAAQIRSLGMTDDQMSHYQDRMAGIHRRLSDVLARQAVQS